MAETTAGTRPERLLGDETPKDDRTLELDIDQIEPNRNNPARVLPTPALDELPISMKANGIVQPIVVRQKGTAYQIVAGERRWRAAHERALAGLGSRPRG